MATVKLPSPELADVEVYLQGIGKNLVDRLYGPAGPAWGTRFADLEDLAHQLGQAVAAQLLQQALQRQADQPVPAADEPCPTCHAAGQPRDPQPRDVTTRDGDAHWAEPARVCPRCRRAFFPSVQSPGD